MADTATRLIVLTYKAPDAKTVKDVYVMGSWDNMMRHRMASSPRGTGVWELPKFLLPGTYYYYFEVDGVPTHDTTQPIKPTSYFSWLRYKLNPWAVAYNELVVSEVKLLLVKHAITGRTVEFAYELSVGIYENWKKAKESMGITESGAFGLKNGVMITSPAQFDHIRKIYFSPSNPTQTPIDAIKNLSALATPSSSSSSPIQRVYHVISSNSDKSLYVAKSLEDAQAWAASEFQGGQLFIRADPPETLKAMITTAGANRCCTVDFYQIGASRTQTLAS